MPVSLFVDPLHLPAEELAVRRGVAQVVDGDIIMNHLVKNRVLDEFFRQVKTGVDTQFEVRVHPFTEEPFTALDEGYFTEKRAGITQFDGYRRQRPIEEKDVILVETRLYVINGGDQLAGR